MSARDPDAPKARARSTRSEGPAVEMRHGAGGPAMRELVSSVFARSAGTALAIRKIAIAAMTTRRRFSGSASKPMSQ